MKLAVVGATGMVGSTILKVLAEREINPQELVLFSTERSAGKKIQYLGRSITVTELTEQSAANSGCDYALFSAGGETSLKFAPIFAAAGCVVIDNSSAFRRDPNVPLVVPQINGSTALKNKGIIANPNCSTIQLVMALWPLSQQFGIERVIVSTYQAVSGAGWQAVLDLEERRESPKALRHTIVNNLIPHIDVFEPNGYTKEEDKVMYESRRILNAEFGITTTAVRVPVAACHCESVNITLKKPANVASLSDAIASMPGVVVTDREDIYSYPMPISSRDRDEVFVGRIREDDSMKNTFNLWIVADNIRKGAATNAVEILEYLIKETKR